MSFPNNSGYLYQYNGPARYHALIGQVLAGLGYVGGKEKLPIGATVTLQEEGERLHIHAAYGIEEETFAAEAWLLDREREKAHIKSILISWYQRYTDAAENPWGILQGVRPTKLVHGLFDRGCTEEAAQACLTQQYEVSEANAASLVRMASLQRPYVMQNNRVVSVYAGIPYCSSHCLYCSFPSRLIGVEKEERLRCFVEAMEMDIADIHEFCKHNGLAIRTAYVGGGTPTCLPMWALERLVRAMRDAFGTVREWTVEAGRPDTATPEKLALLRSYGVDRISVNPQTMQQRILDALGRRHRVEDIYTMYNVCRKLGFRVINMDFIAGLPGQTEKDMQENMEIVCQLHPENVTIHTLALKKRAPLFHHVLRQAVPPAKTVENMLLLAEEVLSQNGYIPYYMYRQTYMAASLANVGYALPGTIGIYNIEMMEERQPVLGAGPGSATKLIVPDGHSLEKLYMPKTIEDYVRLLPDRIRQRHHAGTIIYGGEDW